ncbi:MAG TPA: DUF2079 domain-containing protein [Dehalococcoidia bacterium]|nr:DUF2079 domain-containing protein [Dehalococcoidia bacterium]
MGSATQDLHLETRDSGLGARLTYLVVGLYALTFAAVSLLLHDTFRTNAFDLGNLDQAIWNTSQGRWFEFTNWSGGRSRLAAHVEPILIPIAALYWVWSSPKTLLILQSIVIALGALPAFWLARARLRNEFAGFAFAAAYLLAPELQAANLRDFHPVALAAAFLLFAFYFADRERWKLCWLFATLAMATKEEIPLSIALLGAYLFFVRRRRRMGWALAGYGVVWLVIAVGAVLPAFSSSGASPYLERYSHLGEGPGGILLALVTRPHDVLASVLIPEKVAYLRSLLGPVMFLSLFSPLTLALGLPDLALNILSNYEWMYSGGAHYSAAIIPFVVISAVFGTRWLALRGGRLAGRMLGGARQGTVTTALVYGLSAVVLAASLKSYVDLTLLPLTDDFPTVTDHDRLGAELIRLIPPDAPVTASSGLNPHLSQRRQISLFPEGIEAAQYIAIDVTADPYPIDGPNQWWRIRQLLESGGWGVLAGRDGFLVLERGNGRTDLPPEFFSFVEVENARFDRPLRATFDEAIELLGFDIRPDGALHGRKPRARLTLYFRPQRPIEEDYRVNISVTDLPGALAGQSIYHPATTWLPTSSWRPGATYRVEVAGVSSYGLTEALTWLSLDYGRPDRPDRAAVQAGSEVTVDPVRRAVQLAKLWTE